MPVGVSVGTALFPDQTGDLDGLLRTADAAMYRDKRMRTRVAG